MEDKITGNQFHNLCRNSDLTEQLLIDYINDGGDINYKCNYKFTGLICACSDNHLNVV